MARDIVLGNQQLLINIDKWLQVRDIYFPHVGQYNHLVGHAHKIVVLEGDSLSWISGEGWDRHLTYKNETLVTHSTARNQLMGLTLQFNENVYCEENIFLRKITVENERDHERTIRVAFHQDFHLYGDGIGDTALFHPKRNAIIHYKRSTYFLIGLLNQEDKPVLDDYDTSEKAWVSWEMNKNPIAQGNVNSALAINLIIPAKSKVSFTYYLTVGENFQEVFSLQDQVLKEGIDSHLTHAETCQRGWLGSTTPDLSILDEKIAALYKRSLLIIKTQTDRGGAILAANDSDNMMFNKDTYSYMWPRDGALVAIALIKAGFSEMTKPFFRFCAKALYKEGCLLHKYNPDGTLGSSWHPWVLKEEFSLPIQEDETALVLHALKIYYEHTKDKKLITELFDPLIKPAGKFLAEYRYPNGLPKESYDLWEERRGVFTFTTAAVLAGLTAADFLGDLLGDNTFCETCNGGFSIIKEAMVEHLYNKEKGYFRRGVSFEHGETFDDALDASVYAIWAYDVFDVHDPLVASTMKKVKEWLSIKTEVGGIARYHNDYYFKKTDDLERVPGNPWFICTLWYAKYLIKKAQNKKDLDEAHDILTWVCKHTSTTGVIAEQLHPFTGEPLSVSPLTWSHAEFIDTVTDYVNAMKQFS